MNWRKYFDENIISRGEKYYSKGKVTNFSVDGLTRTAMVVGTQEYVVSLTFSEAGELTDASCNCPYAESGEYCKHMVAVLLANENGEVEPKQKQTKRQLTSKQSEPQKMVRYEESDTELSDFKKRINRIISSYTRKGFIDYYYAYDCAIEVNDETAAVVERKLFMGEYKSAFDCAFFVMRKFSGTDMDDSDGGTSLVCGDCLDYIEQAIADKTTEKYAFKKILSYLKTPDDDEWYAADLLEAFVLEHFDSSEYYALKLNYIDERIEQVQKSDYVYRLNDYLKAKLLIMHKMGCDDKTMDAFICKYWRFAAMEEVYIEAAIERGDVAEAERVLTELIAFPQKEGLSSNYCRNKLLKIYKESGEKEKYRNTLYDVVAEEFKFSMEKYNELKGLYSDSQWVQLLSGLLEKIRKNNSGYYPEVLLQEGLKEKLLQYVLDERGLYYVQKYQKYLIEDYAEKLLEKYKKELTEQMRVASTRDMYKDIVRTLRKISRLQDGKAVVKELADLWRTTYPRRRAMLEELDKLII